MEALHPGIMLNHFRIEHQLGSGGMGSVYCGTDTTLNRQVAIKILDERLQAVPENRERFQREARIIAALRHPNLMQIYFVGEDKGYQYFVMEYIRGQSLQKYLSDRGGKLPLKEALRILIEVISALRKVHGNGIIHRDLKPANIMIDGDDGRAILVDFGLSKECEETAGLTSEGAILGTPDYMSPEQIEGGGLGPHTDIYSLGVILYQMLSGVSPFRRKTTIQTLRAHCESAPPPLTAHDPALPPALAVIVNTMLAKTAAQRYKNIEELAAALYTVCKHPALTRIIGADHAATPDAQTLMAPAPTANRKASVQMRAPGEVPTAPNPQNKIIVACPAQPERPQPQAAKPAVTPYPAASSALSARPPIIVAAQPSQHPQAFTPPAAPSPNRRYYWLAGAPGLLALVLLALLLTGVFSRKRAPKTSSAPVPMHEPELVEFHNQTTKPKPEPQPAGTDPAVKPVTPAPSAATPTAAGVPPASGGASTATPPPPLKPETPPLPVVTFIPAGASAASAAVAAPEVVVLLREGGRLRGKMEYLDGTVLKLRLNPSVVQELPLDQVRVLLCRESKHMEESGLLDELKQLRDGQPQPRLPGSLLRRLERNSAPGAHTQPPSPSAPQPTGRP